MIQLLAAESQLENGTVIWERALQPASNGLYKLQMKCELNKASTLEFVVSPECPYYEQFHLYTTRLTLVDQIDGSNGDVFYFHGRVTKIKSDSFGQKTITAESFMSYLADGVWIAVQPNENEKWYYIKDPAVGWKHVEKAEYDAAENVEKEQRKAQREVQAKKTFEDAVNLYNLGRTSGDYRIEVGDATQFATAKHDDSSKDGSGDLFSKINDDCIKYHGGYLRERVAHRSGGGYTLYLDYVKNYGHTCSQTLEFGKQIISIDREDTSKEFFTSLVAMGDNYTLFQIPTNMTYNVNVTKADGTKMPIQVQVVAGSPYFDIPEALAFAGTRIVHLETFSGVGGTKDKPSPYDLLQPALDYISNNYKPELQSYKVKAVDMHLLDYSVDRIMLGYVVPIIPKFSATAVSLTCTAIDFDFTALENTVFTIGVPDQTLTQKYASTDKSSKKTGRKASATAATVDELSDTFDVHKRRINMIADEEFWAGMQNKEAFISMNDKGEVVFKGKTIYTAADYLLTEITQQDLEIVRNRMSSPTGTTVDTIYQRIFGKDGIGFFGTTKEVLGIGDLVRTNQADIGANSRKFNSYYYADQIDEKLKDYGDELKALANKQDIRWSKYESELQQTAKNLHGYVKQTQLQGIDDYEIELVDPTKSPSGMELYELVDGEYVKTTDTKPIMAEDFDDVRSVTLRESDNPKEMGMYEAVTTSGGKTTYQLSEDTKPYKETYTLYHPTPYELQYVVYDFGDDTTASPRSLNLYERAVGGYVKTEDTTQTQGKKYYILESPAAVGLYQSKISGGATTYILSQDTSQVAGRSYYKAWNPSELELYELKEGNYILSTDTTPQPNKVYYQWGKQAKQYYRVPLKQKAYYKANSRATSIGDIVSGFDALYDSTQMFSKATGIVLDSNGNPTKTWTEYTAWKDGDTPVSLRLYELKDGTGEGTNKPAEYILTSDSERKTGKKYYTWEYVFDQNSSNTILSKIGTTLNKAYLVSAINGDTIDHVQYDSTTGKWVAFDANGKSVKDYVSFASVSTDATGDVYITAINNNTNDANLKIQANKLDINTKNISISSGAIITAINRGLNDDNKPTELTINADRLNLTGVLKVKSIETTEASGNTPASSTADLTNYTNLKIGNLSVDNTLTANGGITIKSTTGTNQTSYLSYTPMTMDLFANGQISITNSPGKLLVNGMSGSGDYKTFQHQHKIEASEETENGEPTGKITLTLKETVKYDSKGQSTSFDIASTKFFQDAIAGASVYSIAYDGASNENPAMSVGTKTISGTSAQVKVLNNVPLLVTYGTDGVTQSTKTYKVSEVELPAVTFQNGSGGTPAITYSDGKPTIDVKAVMSGTTIKSAETYTGNVITLRPSFAAPSASAANKTFTLVAYDGTTISDDTKITSKDVTLQHEIGQITSNKKKYLRVRTNAKNDSGESSSPVFYTDYQITWNSDSIQNTNGSSSVTAKVSINGVQYDTHKFTGTYATADSDNETVRANGWAAALAALEDNDPPASRTLGFGDSRTVTVYQKSQESDTALTTYLTRTYTAPSEPYPILTPKYYGNAISAKMKIDAALNSKSDGTGTAYTNVASKTIELTGSAVTLDARTGSATVIAKVDGTEYATKSVSITAPAPVISVNANGITEKSNKLPVSASLGTTIGLGSMNLEFTVSGGDAISNGPGSSVVQFKYGDKVISEKTVSATYATADSDNETVRADGWAAALNALTYSAPSSEPLDFGEAKTVWIQKRATEGAASTDIFRRTYTAPAKPTINAPTLNTGTINYTTKSVQGGTQFYVQAPIKVTTSVANLGSTGTVDVPIGATVDDATITYDATTGKPTVTANVKVAGVSNAYLTTKAFEGAAPTATLSAGTITEKSGKLPILAKMGNVQIGSTNLEFTVSGGTSASDNIVQFKYGTNVISEKTVSIGGSLAALTIPDKDDTTHPLRVDDGKLLCNPLYRMSTENQGSYWTDISIGEVSITGGGSIGQYGGEKTIVASVGGVEIGRTTVNATYEAAKTVTVMQPYLDSFGNPKVRAVGSGAMEVTRSTSTRPYYYPRIVVYSGSTITHDITFDANKVLVNANIGSPSTSITTNGYHTASEFGFDYLTGVDVAVTGTGAPSLIYQKLARTDTMFQTFVPNANPYTIPSDWTRFAVILNGNSQIFTISSAINTDPVGNDDAEQGEIEQVYLVSSLTGPLNGQSTTISYRDPHTGNTTTSTGYWYKANAPISSYSATIN